MARYPFHEIEPRWQQHWQDNKTFEVTEDPRFPPEKRCYVLDMFPYPSGSGLHVGHPEGYTATDIYSRYLRMNGYNVMHPMGFDSFGLPAENYAIRTGTHPQTTTEQNIQRFREQIRSLGLSYDWNREVITSDPDYYKWTQWIFIQLFKKGLAYESKAPINWCTSCKTGLANEEVANGHCDRCGSRVERRNLRQWVLKITAYAERLLQDLELLDWPNSVKAMQENWIGRSEGAEVDFPLAKDPEKKLRVFTTRPDTLYGATYMVIAPEHPWVPELCNPEQKEAVDKYLAAVTHKSDLERTDLAKDKTGVFSGSYAVNPLTGQNIPIWIADYILISYGTGAIMAVPAHDQRDWEFARKFDLPVVQVLEGGDISESAFTGDGCHINSDELDGLNKQEAISKAIGLLEQRKLGRETVQYKLRDWLFSRQRYWGEPIPVVHCDTCGIVTVPEEQLPLRLPEVQSYQPTDGESPLAAIEDWIHCRCPNCAGPARRETNTMPQWAGSCWYYLRYLSPKDGQHFVSRQAEKYWMPVDLYVGGAEHAVLHLLYARFWHKVLYDLGLVQQAEPFQRLVNQGMILGQIEFTGYLRKDGSRLSSDELLNPSAHADELKAKDGSPVRAVKLSEEQLTKKGHDFVLKEQPEIKVRGQAEKMSKSRGNIVNPDDVIADYGADTLRLYEMFMGPLQMVKPWATGGLAGIHRFLNRMWSIGEKPHRNEVPEELSGEVQIGELRRLLHRTIKKVSQDTKNLEFNTAISQMMVLSNSLSSLDFCPLEIWRPFVLLLSPYAPHLSEELWQQIEATGKTLAYEPWPTWDEALCQTDEKEIVFQVNGKLRSKALLPADAGKEDLLTAAKNDPKIQEQLAGKTVRKEIVVPGRLVNIVAN
ncbi:leucine--tRNA ligase [Candidatus Haliotispira prima]|uniref:Leucine--tRNA ligase n=1 Tax=Candidatus Haliotispira prima TaxID=3034016 RepID=A0ABY8MHY0_9SPIO|nr:leucine--tRNA ligase [Candidatus Haliotispira prima]